MTNNSCILKENKSPLILRLIMILLISAVTFLRGLNCDITYNFAFSHMIKEGLLPYRDMNMIMTPLFQIANSLFLNIWDHIFMTKIIGLVFTVFLGEISCKLASRFLSRRYSIVFGYGLILMMFYFTDWNYNFVGNGMAITGIYLILNSSEHRSLKRLVILLGILSSISLLCKQSQGVIVAISLFTGFAVFYRHKLNFKEILKYFLWFSVPILISGAILLLYLSANGILNDFIELCITGIWSFTGADSFSWKNAGILLIILVSSFIAYAPGGTDNNDISLISVMALFSLFHIYPLDNVAHMALFIYFMLLFAAAVLTESSKLLKLKRIFLVCAPTVYIMLSFGSFWLKNEMVIADGKYYDGLFIQKEIDDDSKEINAYAQCYPDINVYVLDKYAVYFHTIRDGGFFNYYDIFFKGNLGNTIPLDMIKNSSGIFIVPLDKNDDFFQIDSDSMAYVRSMDKIAELARYEAYCLNKGGI